MSAARDADPADLGVRLRSLVEAVAAADGVLDERALAGARALLQRAGERLGHGVEHTVVALAGATGSGKSSVFNALAERQLSAVGVLRPTTSATSACSWGRDASALLDWLRVDRRHHIAEPDAGPDGLVLLDLPDHDSVAADHRREVDRLVAVADLVVWVLDPQKYADRAIHERYLRPLAGHSGVLLVALHQADRLSRDDLESCRRDLGRLLVDDGLPEVTVVTTSVVTDGGLDGLRVALADRVQERHVAVERLEADVAAVAAGLARHCGDVAVRGAGADPDLRRSLVDALVDAAGVDTVTSAVAGAYRSRAVGATGWPGTRWLRRGRPDPLRRLHLGAGPDARGGSTTPRTSLPSPTAVTSARAETVLRTAADAAAGGLPLAWADAVRAEVEAHASVLPSRLDAAVARTDLGMDRPPRWWRGVGVAQTLLFVVALTGLLWLAALIGLSYLQLDVETPHLGRLPVPTLLTVGGLALGALLALAARRVAAVGGRRRARAARTRLASSVEAVADAEVFGPVEAVLDRHRRFCAAVGAASGGAVSSRGARASRRGGRRGTP